MLMIQHIISDMENEFMAWFHVFLFDDVMEIGQLVGYFEKQAIPRINGYFDVTASMHFDSHVWKSFQNEERDSQSPNKNDWKLQAPSSQEKQIGNAPLSEKAAQKTN